MSRTRKIILIVSGIVLTIVIVGIVAVLLLIAAFRNTAPSIADNSVLVLSVRGSMPDYINEDPIAQRFFGAPDLSLNTLTTQLKKAKTDKRVGAVLLEIEFNGAGWAKADELRDAISDYRASGKPIYAYMEYGADMEYYIATACDRIYVAPAGDLFINGLAAEAMFLRGSLDKLGVYFDSYQIGKYKNAVERFTRKEMSEGHRETINAILDDQFARYISNVAKSRNKSPEDVRALIDNAPVGARDALAAGLIDGASYRDGVESELKKRLGYKDDDKLRKVRDAEYRRVTPDSLGLNAGERIAVIFAAGPIGSGNSDGGQFGEQSIGSDTVMKALNDARDDKTVKAIVLRVDSPGGQIYASDIIWGAVESAKAKKPVVVSMGDAAASGGYYISATANKIIAQPSTITGSIGIFGGKPVMKGFYDWIGVSSEYVLRGKNAGMFRETETFTPEERAKFEEGLKKFYYDAFLPKVAEGRKRDVEYIDSIAQGRVWTGTQAKERGLVDEFGGLDRAVEVAKQLADIPADKGVRRVIFPAPRGFLQEIFGGGDNIAALRAKQQRRAVLEALPEDMRRAFKYAALFDQMKHGEAMALMPFELRIK
ncbi:MAG TPA: signal peptide peptidase SppA [Pyrinomonadaceae bacterium]|nr:signal peptide peptidase SppA [Pyrinomonadaceae bacterium]